MDKKLDHKGFWNRYAKLYDFEINRFSARAYKEMYRMMEKVLSFANALFDTAIISNALHIMPDPEIFV